MLELDRTQNKSNLGANAMLGASRCFTPALQLMNSHFGDTLG